MRCALTQSFSNSIETVTNVDDYFKGKFSLPPQCPDGTCDGCNYHFMWTSIDACRLCNMNEYNLILGECVWGKRNVHLKSTV